MINVKNANYLQIDHKVKNIFGLPGVIVLPSLQAWLKFEWTRPYFVKKPKEGYFVWVKKQVDSTLTTCLTIASPKVYQNLTNLMVVEKGIKAKANVVCNAAKNNLYGSHRARGKLILKEGASLEYNHVHKWGQNDFVSPNYEFILGKDSSLVYNYQNLLPPKQVSLKTTIHAGKNASANLNFVLQGKNDSKIDIYDALHLEGENSQGIVKLRLVGKERSEISAKSLIVAKAASKGHLDCQGLLVDKGSKISLMPELICHNKKAQLTHEASIGKISEEELNYLRMRGLSEKEAIDLIVSGFLKQ
ncbi:MAG: SufD family Fe-S cluster assembly protein [Candidatus Pacebacteria bacterium]|nr:SufD family Fe-S cluster assembly protein [Candidatus Paceibacterota bacterium]